MFYRVFKICVALLAIPLALFAPVLAANIDATYKYAWSENLGWINFGTAAGDVTVADTELTGYAWSENAGWISLNCSNTSSCGTNPYKVANNGSGILSGYAWGENVGWINFAPTYGGVTISATTGQFFGYAWGENTGWVIFNCATTSSCGSNDYRTQTTWPSVTPTPGPGGGTVGTGGTPLPPLPTVSPGATPVPTVVGTPGPTPAVSPPSGTPVVQPPAGTPPAVEPPGPPPIGGGGGILPEPIRQVFAETEALVRSAAAVVAPTAGVVTTVATAVAAVPVVAQVLEVSQAAGMFTDSVRGIFGLKRRTRVWGTIYDARTKKPIPFVRVQLFDTANRLLESRVSDRDGRYGFLTSPGSLRQTSIAVRIHVEKPGYAFPSHTVSGVSDFFVFSNLYFGSLQTVSTDTLIHFDIPLDPSSVIAPRAGFFSRPVVSGIWSWLLDISFWAGVVVLPLNVVAHPSLASGAYLALFAGVNWAHIASGIRRPYGAVRERASGAVVPFALVELMRGGERLAFAVSNELGRFVLQAPEPGTYTIVLHTPAQVLPQKTLSTSVRTRGWITDELYL